MKHCGVLSVRPEILVNQKRFKEKSTNEENYPDSCLGSAVCINGYC